MSNSTSLLYKIALTKIPKIGPKSARLLVSYCGGVESIFKEKKKNLLKIPSIGIGLVNAIQSKSIFHKSEAELKLIQNHRIKTCFYLDPSYPVRLKHYDDAPVMIYTKGNIDYNTAKIISIVGTRKPTDYGIHFTEKLIDEIKSENILIVSGLAHGIDTVAHRSALQAGLPTVGFLGHGLAYLYPAANKQLAQKMIQNGAIATEFDFNVIGNKEHFPMRNRIIAGICDALVVVESKNKGGSMITAAFANNYNKDVFALPGKVSDIKSEGCNHLIKSNKAHLLQSAKDLYYIMNWNRKQQKTTIQPSLFIDLNKDEKLITDIIKNNDQISIDLLAHKAELHLSKLSSYLLNLEFKGVIRNLPGKRYSMF